MPRTGTVYFPHPLEFVISLSIVAAGILAYLMAGRYLPIVPQKGEIRAAGLNSS